MSPVDATPSALVLDLDGVLLDTLPVMREAWKTVQLTHGITLPFERYAEHLGRPFDDIMALLGIDDATAIHDTYTKASVSAASLPRAIDGVEDVLWAFARAGWRLAIVTSKALDRAAPLIARLGCPFASIRTPESTGRGKPAPDHLLLTAVTLGLDPVEMIYVGDMPVDHEAACRAGVRFVHAAWGYGEAGCPAPEIADSPADLLRLLHASRDFAAVAEPSAP